MNKISRLSIIILFDILLIILSNQISFIIRLEKFFLLIKIEKFSFYLAYFIITYILVFLFFKFQKISNRFFSIIQINQLVIPFTTIFLLWSTITIILQTNGYPRSIGLITFVSFFLLFISSRLIVTTFLNYNNEVKKNIIIVGFNSNIYDLIKALITRNSVKSIFIEKNTDIFGKNILGVKTRNINKLIDYLNKNKINEIIIDSRYFKNQIIKELLLNLDKYGSKISSIDSNKTMNVADVQQVELNDIIYRGISELDFSDKFSDNDVILVTGGAGSIGSALIFEILKKFNIKNIICIDMSENNSFKLKQSISDKYKNIKYFIGNVGDKVLISTLIKKYKINIIFHCAAYKHVPIMEENVNQAFKNNCLNTLKLVEVSVENKIEKFIFISSDKAVRPTNIMGLTKRISESIIDNYQQKYLLKKIDTKFTTVRFGNVLESSGSLIPILRSQILSGGPITITHEEVTRYFMTLSEAAHLVLESSFISEGKEIFLFDMGQPMKIIDLAKRMINLYGRQLKSTENSKGIEIKIIGLRPGEKLYEELLVDNKSTRTINKNIYISNERRVSELQFKKYMEFINNDIYRIAHIDLRSTFNDEYCKYFQE